ncbi:MAG: AAA+-type ATPase [Pycnora praestabilis]|nr:MAG: AAA+-type ATPase [Pycnora praestabilis]
MADSSTYSVRPLGKSAGTDLKDAFKIYLSPGALDKHKLGAGDPCLIIAADSPPRTAIAWTARGSIQNTVVVTSSVFQSTYGIKLSDKVSIQKRKEGIEDAQVVYLTDMTPDSGTRGSSNEDVSSDNHYWEWFLEHPLERAEYITSGMLFENIEVKGSKRTFQVDRIGSTHDLDLYRFSKTSKVKIQHEETKISTDTYDYHPLAISADRVGGLTQQLKQLNDRLSAFIGDRQRSMLSPDYPRSGGVLLHGPAGTGKSLLLKKLAAAPWRKVFTIDASDSAATVRKVFAEALKHQRSVIIIDEIDVIAAKRSSSEGVVAANLASYLKAELDKLGDCKVFVIAATRRPTEIHESLRTPGRLEYEIEIPIPDAKARVEIIKVLLGLKANDQSKLLEDLGERTHGYVGSDLGMLIRLAEESASARYRIKHLSEGYYGSQVNGVRKEEEVQVNNNGSNPDRALSFTQEDIDTVLPKVRPTAMREVFLETPKVRWSDIGGQEEVKQSLRELVEWPFKDPETMEYLDITPKKGILLYGPPGCSKTLIAKAVATEAGLNFLAVKGAELINMYVGESERAVREVFRKARAASPSVIFFDEIDSIAMSREAGGQSSGLNVLTTLLNEMDGIESLKGVLVLAATNKPELLDPALMRPGRLDTKLYLGPPDFSARQEILRIALRKTHVGNDVDISDLAEKTKDYTGAEIVHICDNARYAAWGETMKYGRVPLCKRHLDNALMKVVRQNTPDMLKRYEQWNMGSATVL